MPAKQGASRAVTVALAITASLVFGTAAAVAGGRDTRDSTRDTVATDGGPEFSVNATYTSDYRLRGFTQTQGKSALQGGFDVIWPNFYMGVWASNVDFGNTFDGVSFHNAADIELSGYAGLKRNILGYDVDLRATYYAYPGSFGVLNGSAVKDLNYFEAMVGLSREVIPGLTLNSRIYYSPDYQGGTGQNWVFESGITRKLASIGSVTPSLSAQLGSSYGEDSKGGIDYYYWNAGVSFLFANYFELDLRYFDTFDVPTGGSSPVASCNRLCDGRFVARITFEN